MKVAVLNYTGKVGKTTICANLLSPRMNAPIFAIETANETASSHGLDVQKLRGDQFRDLYKQLLSLDDAIIDVGASNIEAFLDKMLKIEESHIEFDYFVVPVVSGTVEQRESVKMLQTLADIGIPADKIRVVFNRVNMDVSEEFPAILGYAKKTKTCVANPEAAIFENEVYSLLAAKKITLTAVMADETDYKAFIRAKSGTEKDMENAADMHALKGMAKGAARNLDAVFHALFSK